MVTLEALSSISTEAARLAIQVDVPAHVCPAGQMLTAQALLDQGLGEVEVQTVLRAMNQEEHISC